MKKEFHIQNREKLINHLPENSIVVFYSGKPKRRSADVFYEFEVDKNFFYLTGVEKENMALVIEKNQGQVSQSLFMLNHDIEKEKWFGKQLHAKEVKLLTGIEHILDFNELEQYLFSCLCTTKTLLLYFHYYMIGEDLDEYRLLNRKVKMMFPDVNVLNSLEIMTHLRYIKSEFEIACIKKSIDLIAEGLKIAREYIKDGNFEYQVRNAYENYARSKNENIYGTVCATGENATYLHHPDQNSILKNGDMFLIDVGAKTYHYFGDISRTYPVGNKFTDKQKQIYSIVLLAQRKAIELAKDGVSEFTLNQAIKDVYVKELMKLGLIVNKEEVDKYYYHNVGHPVGLDVHDLRPKNRILKTNAVYTIEPGLYIKEWGLGIRIEDDILITDCSNIVLSKDIEKD